MGKYIRFIIFVIFDILYNIMCYIDHLYIQYTYLKIIKFNMRLHDLNKILLDYIFLTH